MESAVEQQDSPPISLLWPEPRAAPPLAESPGWAEDLNLAPLLGEMEPEPAGRRRIGAILAQLCREPEVIRYRQEILRDILEVPGLEPALRELQSDLGSITRYHLPREKGELFYEVNWRLGELDSYQRCVRALEELLGRAGEGLRSAGLGRLRRRIRQVRSDPVFGNLERELPDLLHRVRGITSVTVGLNLNQDLQPVEAVLLEVGTRRFGGGSGSVLGRLFGRQAPQGGVAPLHRVPAASGAEGELNPLLVPLFRDLAEVLADVCRPVARELQRYLGINSRFLSELGRELSFYLAGAAFLRRLRALGLPTCFPQVASFGEGACELRDAYEPNLALRFAAESAGAGPAPSAAGEPAGLRESQDVEEARGLPVAQRLVCNDISFGPQAGVFLLTGPNRGGKTTYMQAVGLIHVLAQAGLAVPAREARLSPVDGIFTHFPRQERPEMHTGRLGEEAGRLRRIFEQASPDSLVLLNESLATTSARESLELARDVVRGLRRLGARTIYTTHLHELASQAERLNAETPGRGRVVSLVSVVAGRDGAVLPTFRIVAAPPAGSSHARQVALSHGISYEQLEETLRRRGLVE